MRRPSGRPSLLFAIAVCASVTGCGQKGPLVLPSEAAQTAPGPGAAAAAGEPADEDAEGEDE